MFLFVATFLARTAGQPDILAPAVPAGDVRVIGWASCLAKGTDVATLDCFPLVFQRFVYAAFVFAGITAIILIALAGIKLILSSGDAKKLEGARSTITYAIVGLFIIFLAAFIVSIIALVTGVTCLNVAGFQNCAG